MSEVAEANTAWRAADAEVESSIEDAVGDRNWYGIKKMLYHIRIKWKLKTEDLHDAVLHACIAPPKSPSMLAYVNLLCEHCGTVEQMQHRQQRKTIIMLKEIQKCFQRGGQYFGAQVLKGKGQHAMFADRIARIVGELMEQAKRTQEGDEAGEEDAVETGMDDEDAARAQKRPRVLHLSRRDYASMPQEAVVSELSLNLEAYVAPVQFVFAPSWDCVTRMGEFSLRA